MYIKFEQFTCSDYQVDSCDKGAPPSKRLLANLCPHGRQDPSQVPYCLQPVYSFLAP